MQRFLCCGFATQQMIMNPLRSGGLQNMFSTHPSTDERIARLMEMARTGRFD